jgi:hypothetical protein
MMEATSTSETLVNFYQTTRRYNPEDSTRRYNPEDSHLHAKYFENIYKRHFEV